MRIGKTLLVLLVVGLFAAPAFAQIATPINSQGTSGAPVSVSSSAVAVLLGNPTRQHWALYTETVAIRCTLGTNAGTGASSAGKGTPTPTSSVGFFFNTGILYTEQSFQLGSATAGRELDCVSTGAATNVDTWEEASEFANWYWYDATRFGSVHLANRHNAKRVLALDRLDNAQGLSTF